MTKKQKFKEVCDEWTQHALCPAGDTCAKLYGREAMKHVCSLHLYKGKCHMASEIGHKSHPPQPQIIGTPYLKGLDLKRERQVALECLVNEVSAGGLDAQQSRDVASYSWVKGTTKQIAVPGLPRELDPPNWPQNIISDREDKEKYLASQARRHTSKIATFDPLIHAVLTMNGLWDSSQYDFISQHISLKRLLEVARGVELKNFRIDLEMRGKTLYLSQWLEPIDIPQTVIVGKGGLFTETVTSSLPGFEELESHKHIVEYSFAGVRMLVETPVDAFQGYGNSGVEDPMDKVDLDKNVAGIDQGWPSSLQVLRKGRLLTSRCLVQTRAQDMRNHDEDYICADVFISRQKRVYLGRYNPSGTFTAKNVQERDFTKDVADWVTSRPWGMKKFAALLSLIQSEAIDLVKSSDCRSLSLVFQARDKQLKMYPRTNGKLLVSDEMSRQLQA